MGQKFSALKKSRKARKQADRAITLDEPTNEILSREDDYAISSSSGVESTQISSIDTSFEDLPPTSEPEAEITPITLPKLCTELILDIAEYLPPSSCMSLSYTCRTMRNKMGVSFAEVLGDGRLKARLTGSTLSIESRNIRYLERLELWDMLARDGMFSSRKAWSSGYRTKLKHDYLMETTRMYTPLSRKYRDPETTGLLWVCPHQRLDYLDAGMGRGTDDFHQCGSSHVFSSKPIVIRWLITRIPKNSVLTNQEVVEALRPLNAPICPHLRLNDASVAQSYDSTCRKLYRGKLSGDPVPACPCSDCSSGGPLTVICSYCDTSIMFDIEPAYDEGAMLCLFIMRTYRYGGSSRDRKWISQIAPPNDWKDYEMAWEATNAECSRRTG